MAEEMGGDASQIEEDHLIGATNVDRDHSWGKAIFFASGISMSVGIDILQYTMPLAFLPSRLEDTGYTNFQIACAVGIYYWTGLAVTCTIAIYHVSCVLREKPGQRPEAMSVHTIKTYIVYALTALTGGTITLFVEGLFPIYTVHLCCRIVQGGCGGVIFIFGFLTACSLFKGKQQVFSLTMCSVMFNVAEVLGPYCGALVYDYMGMSAVFYILGVFSCLCQLWFLAIIFSINKKEQEPGVFNTSGLPQRVHLSKQTGWARFKSLVLGRRFVVSVLLIATAAMIKGGVEECLPFHADHEWKLTPMKIGEFFSIIAVSYLVAAAVVGQLWTMSSDCGCGRVVVCAVMLAVLGVSTWALFSIHSFGGGMTLMWCGLSMYGVCLGVTFTPATLLIGDAVENEDPGAAKDSVNSMWNTMWEAGGSLGFLMGGVFAHNYTRMIHLFTALAVLTVIVAAIVIAISWLPVTTSEIATGYKESPFPSVPNTPKGSPASPRPSALRRSDIKMDEPFRPISPEPRGRGA